MTNIFLICAQKYSLESSLKVLSSDMLKFPIGQAVRLLATYRAPQFLRAKWHVREVYGRIYIISAQVEVVLTLPSTPNA
jgi:hypothetical protein